MSCVYNRNTQKWDVKFNTGKTYSYAYLNVEKLTEPDVLNPNMYRISRDGREFFDVNAIYVFRSGRESYWHICFGDGSERDYRRNDLHIIESCLAQSQSSNVFEYIKQIALEFLLYITMFLFGNQLQTVSRTFRFHFVTAALKVQFDNIWHPVNNS